MLRCKISGEEENAQEKKGLSTSGATQHIDINPICCIVVTRLFNILI